MKTPSHQVTPSQPVNTASLGASALEFLECLQKASGSTSLEIDLSTTEVPDSGTVKFLLAAANDCRQRGISPAVKATGKTAELLRLLNMDQHLSLNTGEVSE